MSWWISKEENMKTSKDAIIQEPGAAVQPDSSHDLGNLGNNGNHLERVEHEEFHWGKASERCDFLKFSFFSNDLHCYSNEVTWYPNLSDPTTVFRPRPRTASVSLQKHVGKWQYLNVMKRFWGCLRFLHDMQRIPWVIPSDFNHKTFFQSKTLSFWILKVLTDTFEEHKNTGVCHWCGFRVKPCGF